MRTGEVPSVRVTYLAVLFVDCAREPLRELDFRRESGNGSRNGFADLRKILDGFWPLGLRQNKLRLHTIG